MIAIMTYFTRSIILAGIKSIPVYLKQTTDIPFFFLESLKLSFPMIDAFSDEFFTYLLEPSHKSLIVPPLQMRGSSS